jgi:hypothetical protein
MPFRGAASAISATTRATSSAAMGWNKTGGSRATLPATLASAMPPRNSRNWVARMMVYGMPEATINFSWATLPRK